MPVPSRRTRALVFAAAPAAVLAAAAPALAAATLHADRPCYTPGETITLSGEGYTASGEVWTIIAVDAPSGRETYLASEPTRADAAGAFVDHFAAPELPSELDVSGEVSVTANDAARIDAGAPPEEQFGAATFALSVFDAWLDGPSDPRATVTLRAHGFSGSRRLWAHYVLRGRRRATVPLGAVRGPCGDLSKRIRRFPMRRPARGTWHIYVSDAPRSYSRRDSWVRLTERVR